MKCSDEFFSKMINVCSNCPAPAASPSKHSPTSRPQSPCDTPPSGLPGMCFLPGPDSLQLSHKLNYSFLLCFLFLTDSTDFTEIFIRVIRAISEKSFISHRLLRLHRLSIRVIRAICENLNLIHYTFNVIVNPVCIEIHKDS